MAHSHVLALVLGALRTLCKWLKRVCAKADIDVLPQGDGARQWYERMVPANKDVEISATGMLSDMISTTRSREKIQFCHQTIKKAEKILKKLAVDSDWQDFFLRQVRTSPSCPPFR